MKLILGIAIITGLVFSGCKKGWLDVRSNKSLVVPFALNDLQSIMDNDALLNAGGNAVQFFAEMGSDNYYMTNDVYESFTGFNEYFKNAYTFSKEIYPGRSNIPAWNIAYRKVFYANTVLDELKTMSYSDSEESQAAQLRGTALFIRAYTFFQLAQVFSEHYDSLTFEKAKGIPIRISSNFNEATTRSTVKETYERILQDLHDAIPLLPKESVFKNRPSGTAAHALLARVYLSIGDFEKSKKHASLYLENSPALLDYNSLQLNLEYPVPELNKEVVYVNIEPTSLFIVSKHRVDSGLYRSYENGDIRKNAFFKVQNAAVTFRGSYDGSDDMFTGISTDEMYLTRAECFVRLGDIPSGLKDLNTFLKTRWNPSYFHPVVTSDKPEALSKILAERRKQLCFRGLRWMDLRRLNKEPAFQTTVKRVVKGVEYFLVPGDVNYVYPIPDDIIAYTGILQNTRR